jgi:hypothetical protein
LRDVRVRQARLQSRTDPKALVEQRLVIVERLASACLERDDATEVVVHGGRNGPHTADTHNGAHAVGPQARR